MPRRLLMACLGLAAVLAWMVPLLSAQEKRGANRQGTRKKDAPGSGGGTEPKQDKGEAKASGDAAADSSAKSEKRPRIEEATFAGGCFWSIEAVFEHVPGVRSVVSGFSGGTVANPSYDMVSTGMTGHAESVNITYDASIVSYEKLLKIFFAAHDPTTVNSQGDDFGPQYRSMIFYRDDAQRKAAIAYYRELSKARARRSPIVTELVPFAEFFPAEPYHQDYFRTHPDNDYSQFYIVPKLHKLRAKLK